MNMKKILSFVLVVALVVCGAAAIVKNNEAAKLKTQLEETAAQVEELSANASTASDLQSQLDEANARIAELEAAAAATAEATAETSAEDSDLQAMIDLYKPYYDAQVVVAFEGGAVMLPEVLEQYAQYEQAYAQYGIDLASYGMDTQFKQTAAQSLLDYAVMDLKAAELGLDQIDEATLAGLTEEAASNYETYVTSVLSYFESEDLSDEEVRAQAVEYLESEGYTEESVLESMIDNYVHEAIYNHITADVAVNDEDIQATYDALVVEQMSSYATDSAYNDARNNGELIVWNPEGYRAVKHVLVKFSDEQSASLDEMNSTLDALNDELEAAQAPVEETEEEASEEESTEETTEETAEVRTVEEITADIAAMEANIEALYAELLPTAEEVIEKFNAGTAFADLIAEYNEDPGMTSEPTATNGYAVAAESTTWDTAFRDGAMSIESVGGISAPVYGSYGIHVIFYESDIPAGAVEFETVKAEIEAKSLDDKLSNTYNTTLDEWIASVNPVYHYENLG